MGGRHAAHIGTNLRVAGARVAAKGLLALVVLRRTGQPRTMKIDMTMALADAVDTYPVLAREFERRNLDYCCGGARSIAEACALVGADPSPHA